MNLETGSTWENRQDARPVRRSVKLPEADAVARQPSGSRGYSTQVPQRPDIAKEIPVFVPEIALENPEPNTGSIQDVFGRERRRTSGPTVSRRTGVRFWLLNKWQGQVLSVGQDTFKAQLHDASHPNTIEHAEFFISDLPEDGRAMLRPGALFYWMIGYRDEGSRQRTRESIVWMRRSGIMGAEKFKTALDNVQQIWDAVCDGDQQASSR
jgi:hypothetical protein